MCFFSSPIYSASAFVSCPLSHVRSGRRLWRGASDCRRRGAGLYCPRARIHGLSPWDPTALPSPRRRAPPPPRPSLSTAVSSPLRNWLVRFLWRVFLSTRKSRVSIFCYIGTLHFLGGSSCSVSVIFGPFSFLSANSREFSDV